MSIGLDELGYDDRLYILAFDHRGSFEKMVGDNERVPGAKTLIWEGFQRAVEQGAPKSFAGVLVDGQYGPDVAREAKAGGYKLAMPVEKSGQNEFDFEYGDRFGEKIEEFDPDFSKVLVRYNPEGDQAMNERQIEKLRRLSEWLRAGAGLDGYIGFAIGRSIFGESVKAYAADPDGFDRDAAVEKIARNYLRFIEVYEGAPAPA